MWTTLLWFSLIVLTSANKIMATPAIKPQSSRGIIFPSVEQFENCFVDEQRTVKGTCRSLHECASALERWNKQNIRPQTCYFNKFEHIICCEDEKSTPTPSVPDVQQYTGNLNAKRPSERECALNHGPRIAVVHGEPTKPKEFPYMAALAWDSFFDKSPFYRCGGVLISETFVLTAAHCSQFGGQHASQVRLGGVNLTDTNPKNYAVKTVHVHPDYDVNFSYNDIALLELQEKASEGTACVWSEPELPEGNVTAIGYGHTRFAGSGSDQLLKAVLSIVPNAECERFYPPDQDTLQNGVASSHICAGDTEKLRDTCQGDSGGPIVMKVIGNSVYPYVVGITSFGLGCAGGPPGIYTRTSSYIDWIESIVWPAKKLNNPNSNEISIRT